VIRFFILCYFKKSATRDEVQEVENSTFFYLFWRFAGHNINLIQRNSWPIHALAFYSGWYKILVVLYGMFHRLLLTERDMYYKLRMCLSSVNNSPTIENLPLYYSKKQNKHTERKKPCLLLGGIWVVLLFFRAHLFLFFLRRRAYKLEYLWISRNHPWSYLWLVSTSLRLVQWNR